MRKRKILKKLAVLTLSMSLTFDCFNAPIKNVFSVKNVYADAFENSISAFPESYKSLLRELHKTHSKWTFTAFNTNINFDDAVLAEASNDRSLVEKSYSDYLKSNAKGDYNARTGQYIAKDSGRWVSASKNAVAYYMDPRNFLNDQTIFMFENLAYDKNNHTESGVNGIVKGSYMDGTYIAYYDKSGKLKKVNTKYSKAIMNAAESSKVSPYYIASKIMQECGKATGYSTTVDGKKYTIGEGSAINGKHDTYPGIYNFYNIGASDSPDPTSKGLKWASSGKTYQRPWNTPEKSISGGATYIGEKYINCGQYTPYFQRFNVNTGSEYDLYTHQYMTALPSVAQEAFSTYNAYLANGGLDTALNFVIPVYKNMPNMNTTIHIGSEGNRTGSANTTLFTRKGPSVSYDITGRIATGTKVTIIDYVRSDTVNTSQFLVNPYWYKVTYVDTEGVTQTVYVSARFIDVDVTDEFYLGVSAPLEKEISNEEKVYYMTDNPAVATVDDDGNVKGVSEGTTCIRAYAESGKCSVIGIKISRIGVTFAKKKYYVPKGEKKQIKANVYTLLEDKSVTYTTSNSSVATVDTAGVVTGVNYGTVTITATTNVDKKTATTTVQVVKPVKSVKLNRSKKNITAGNTYQLVATIIPGDASVKTVKWSSSDKSVAKVSKEGLVTAIKPGTCEITVKSVEGSKKDTCTINVKPKKIEKIKIGHKGYDKLNVTWDVQSGVDGYIVYKRNSSTKKFERVSELEGINNNAYLDKELVIGRKYRYKVRSFVTIGEKKYLSSLSAVKVGKTRPGRATITELESKKSKVKVSFKAVRGATHYRVFRKDNITGKYKKIKAVKSNKLFIMDKKVSTGVTYTYKVQAIIKKGTKLYKGKQSVEKSVSR